MTRTLYLAYHRSDGDLAHRVHDLAEELGYYVWRHIPTAEEAPGEQLRAQCRTHRAESLYLVAVVSSSYVHNAWLLRDVETALELGMVVLVAAIEDVELPEPLRSCRTIDVGGIRAGGLALLHGFLDAEMSPPARLEAAHPLGACTTRDLRLLALDHWDRLDLDELLLCRFIDLDAFPERPNDRLVSVLHDHHRVDLAGPLADLLVRVVPDAARSAGRPRPAPPWSAA